jgi:hypothetical protein
MFSSACHGSEGCVRLGIQPQTEQQINHCQIDYCHRVAPFSTLFESLVLPLSFCARILQSIHHRNPGSRTSNRSVAEQTTRLFVTVYHPRRCANSKTRANASKSSAFSKSVKLVTDRLMTWKTSSSRTNSSPSRPLQISTDKPHSNNVRPPLFNFGCTKNPSRTITVHCPMF